MNGLPDGWEIAPIEDVVVLQENGKPFQQGWSPQCESRPGEADEWAVLKTTAIQDGEFWAHENKALPSHLEPRPHIEIAPGDVLMTCAGPRSRCGVVCLVTETRSNLMMSGKMYRFRPHPRVLDSRLLSFFIRGHETQLRIDAMKTGINDSGLNLTHARFGRLPVVVPPLNEQHRIVEQIETLFAEIDAGVKSLEAARTALGLYRQSLLKTAFEGRLTEEWRAANPDKLETPDALLARIHHEREARYTAALVDWKTACAAWENGDGEGKKPARPKNPKPVIGSVSLSLTEGTHIPEGWLWLPAGDLGRVRGGLTKNAKRAGHPRKVAYLRVANVYADRLELNDISEIGVTYDEFERTQVEIGDLLFVEGNGSVDQIGRVAEWNGSVPDITHQNHLIRFTSEGLLSPRLTVHFMCSPLGRKLIITKASSTSGLYTLSISKIEGLPIVVCSPSEQTEIVRILDARLSAADALGDEIEAGLKRADALRQSILTQAFSGKLVPQNPNDEPASVLLERIRAERAAKPKTKRRRKAKEPS